jgi:mRNA interferase MazF
MLPEAGDVAWVGFDPVLGTEQAGRRPALVVSGREFQKISSRALVCPITSRVRPWPFNVVIPPGLCVEGIILVDQARMIHRPSRRFDKIGALPPSVLNEVRGVLAALAGIALAASGSRSF